MYGEDAIYFKNLFSQLSISIDINLIDRLRNVAHHCPVPLQKLLKFAENYYRKSGEIDFPIFMSGTVPDYALRKYLHGEDNFKTIKEFFENFLKFSHCSSLFQNFSVKSHMCDLSNKFSILTPDINILKDSKFYEIISGTNTETRTASDDTNQRTINLPRDKLLERTLITTFKLQEEIATHLVMTIRSHVLHLEETLFLVNRDPKVLTVTGAFDSIFKKNPLYKN